MPAIHRSIWPSSNRKRVEPSSTPERDDEVPHDADLIDLLDELQLAVVIGEPGGTSVPTNDQARSIWSSPTSGALVRSAASELIERARRGERSEQEIELVGPPSQVFRIVSLPLGEHALGSAAAVIEDITELRRVDQVRRDFVANISHELKTPVGALGLLADALVDENDIEVVHRLANRLANEAHRIGTMVDDLMELSRIEADASTEYVELDLVELIDEVIERFVETARARNIDVSFEQSGQATIVGGRRQITSAISNLLDNAIKYSPDGGSVVIGLEICGEGGVEVTVSDNGVGIPHSAQTRIFERFYRVDQARSRDTGGTGLGLAIVNHVAVNHRGSISVESKEGIGSTFHLRLCSMGGES